MNAWKLQHRRSSYPGGFAISWETLVGFSVPKVVSSNYPPTSAGQEPWSNIGRTNNMHPSSGRHCEKGVNGRRASEVNHVEAAKETASKTSRLSSGCPIGSSILVFSPLGILPWIFKMVRDPVLSLYSTTSVDKQQTCFASATFRADCPSATCGVWQ